MFDRIKTKPSHCVCSITQRAQYLISSVRHDCGNRYSRPSDNRNYLIHINLIVPAFAGVVVNNFKYATSSGFSIWSIPLKHLKSQINASIARHERGRCNASSLHTQCFFVNLRTVISIYTLHANSFFSSAPILWLTTTSNSTAMSLVSGRQWRPAVVLYRHI